MINGSPHRGNTWKLAEIVRKELFELDADCEIAEIHLAELEIPFCTGCSSCFRLGNEKCPHYSKMKVIIEAMEQADGIIFVSSTFNIRPTALLKNMFDHLCFYMHRPHFFTKKALILTTTGGVGGGKAAREIAATLYGIGFNRCFLFSQASYSWNNYKVTEKAGRQLRNKTNRFYRDVKSKRLHAPACMLLIPYNLFRGMSLAYTKEAEYPTADGEYWTQKSRIKGVYDSAVSVPFYKKPIGFFFIISANIWERRFWSHTEKHRIDQQCFEWYDLQTDSGILFPG